MRPGREIHPGNDGGESGAEGLGDGSSKGESILDVGGDEDISSRGESAESKGIGLDSSSSVTGSVDVQLGTSSSDKYVAQCGPTMQDENKVLTHAAVIQITL